MFLFLIDYYLFICLFRYEKQLEQEEQAYQQQRRRLYTEVQEEKERVALQAQKQRQELDEAREALEVSMDGLWLAGPQNYPVSSSPRLLNKKTKDAFHNCFVGRLVLALESENLELTDAVCIIKFEILMT